MTDQVTDHALELPSSSNSSKKSQRGRHANGADSAAKRPEDRSPPVRSDIGTILLHWTLVIAIVTSLLTGMRLSADAEHAWFSKLFEPILPQGEIWTWHYVSAIFVLAVIFAYAAYMTLGRLKRRISSKKIVVLTLPASTSCAWPRSTSSPTGSCSGPCSPCRRRASCFTSVMAASG